MKSLLRISILAALGVRCVLAADPAPTPPPTVGVPSHLQNASFETAGDSPANADHWGVWGEGLARVTDWKPAKNGAAMIAFKHWETKKDDNSGIFQDASLIKAGSKYKFVAPIYLDKPDFGGSARSVELRLESTVNGAQVVVATRTYELPDEKNLPYGEWKYLEVTGTAPVDNLRVLVVLAPQQGQRGGAVKIDDLRLQDAN